MQPMMIYWQSVVPQHISGVFTPIIRRADCKSLPMMFCPGCSFCGSGESGSEMCVPWKECCLSQAQYTHLATRLFEQQQLQLLWKGCCLSQATSFSQYTYLATRLSGTVTATARTEHHRQWLAVCSPDDGRKDARNMLRSNWLPINHHWLHLVGLTFIYLSKMHGYSNIKFTTRELETELSVSKGSVNNIIYALGYSKLCYCLVPRHKTDCHKTVRKDVRSCWLFL